MGARNIQRRFNKLMGEVRGARTDRSMTEVLITIGTHSDSMTPVDRPNLINSRFLQIENSRTGTRGIVGYTADYALYVHEAEGKLKGQPRGKSSRGRFWDPSGEPEFLRKGAEEAKPDIRAVLRKRYKL